MQRYNNADCFIIFVLNHIVAEDIGVLFYMLTIEHHNIYKMISLHQKFENKTRLT